MLLSHQDSNLDWLNQNQMCYHYTMGQSLLLREKQCKSIIFIAFGQIYRNFFVEIPVPWVI
ncbi:MAG: hypothetical protein PWQ71_478 [Bacteroidota bacterium]|nr:hypothetical protein [Bacteroidota bacterium]